MKSTISLRSLLVVVVVASVLFMGWQNVRLRRQTDFLQEQLDRTLTRSDFVPIPFKVVQKRFEEAASSYGHTVTVQRIDYRSRDSMYTVIAEFSINGLTTKSPGLVRLKRSEDTFTGEYKVLDGGIVDSFQNLGLLQSHAAGGWKIDVGSEAEFQDSVHAFEWHGGTSSMSWFVETDQIRRL